MSRFRSTSAWVASSFTRCAPWLPPVTNTQNTSDGMSSKRGCPAISTRTGRPVTTVSRPRRYSAVSGNVMATADA